MIRNKLLLDDKSLLHCLLYDSPAAKFQQRGGSIN
jgi:hypothetical protein